MGRCPDCVSDEVHLSESRNSRWFWVRRLIFLVARCRNCGRSFKTPGYLFGGYLPEAPPDWKVGKDSVGKQFSPEVTSTAVSDTTSGN